jgi:ABC-type Fe3+-siderophore transport system permease subunit
MFVGWGGLALMIFVFNFPPLVWARWGFFALWLIALTGTALPVAYFLNQRFLSNPPAEPNTIVRQALWIGVYGATLAWLQLGHLVTFWIWMGLAGGLIAIEYLIRLREQARWRPPNSDDEQPSDTSFD